MLPARAGVEILVVGAVEVVQAFVRVLHRVAVDEVEQHAHAQAVGGVDQVLQFLRRAEARGDREEVADVIAERAVVRMLLHRP